MPNIRWGLRAGVHEVRVGGIMLILSEQFVQSMTQWGKRQNYI